MTFTIKALFGQKGWSLDGQRGATSAASIALAAVLIILSACALFGAYSSYRAGAAVRYATAVSDAFEQARFFVGAEESLERKYRLEPSPEVHARHRQASVSLLASLNEVRALGSDAPLIDEVFARHADYLRSIDHMFTAIDAGDTALANEIDEREVDPSFDAIEQKVLAAAEAHRDDAAQHLSNLAAIQRTVLIATPIVFVPGVALVAFFWGMLRRYRGQAEQGEQRFRSLVQNSSDVVLISSASGLITYQSPTAETAWGYAPNELSNKPLLELIHSDEKPALRDLWEQLLSVRGSTRNTELQIRTSAGGLRHVDLVITNLLHEPSVEGMVVTAQDITERKAFEKQLTSQAFYDALTGLPNRVLFRDRFDQALARAGRRHDSVGLLYLDLDNFKQINDSLGHHVGDTLLAEFSARLRASVREENTVARLGGDEFVVLLENLMGDADAVLVADRVFDLLKQPFRLEGRDFIISASMGIVLGRTGVDLADSMLRDADVAMYRAKGEGKGSHVIFDASMQIDALARLELENDLRRAINQGELRVHYQPIVSLEGGHVAEVEALVRWQHPTRGLVAPADFIPIAEQTGLIIPLGQWVLEEACRQVVAWDIANPQTPPLTVSVNLSPRQFRNTNLIDEVKRALEESGLPATRLKLEITEGVVMRDIEVTVTTLWQLKELGIQLAIDDFGTGYSSLAYLKRLPFDVLKIDRSFVNGIGRDQEDTAIVRAVISLAKSLDLSITAEGIETAEQSALLKTWACDRGQGYHFARPLEAAALAELLGKAGDLPSRMEAA